MTEIERKALALLNEVLDERYAPPAPGLQRRNNSYHEALCRAIERIEELEATEHDCTGCDYAKPLMELQAEFEAFKREVSDAVEKLLEWTSIRSQRILVSSLSRFIIPKPVDPLVEAIDELWTQDRDKAKYMADQLHKYLAARGGRIVWEGE